MSGFDLHQFPANGVLDKIGDLVQLELLHDVVPMGFHRSDADVQMLGDLAAGPSLGDELQDLALSEGQLVGEGRFGGGSIAAEIFLNEFM